MNVMETWNMINLLLLSVSEDFLSNVDVKSGQTSADCGYIKFLPCDGLAAIWPNDVQAIMSFANLHGLAPTITWDAERQKVCVVIQTL